MHSKKFEKVKKYYEMYIQSNGEYGWNIDMVKNAVVKGWITEEEYYDITGQVYI